MKELCRALRLAISTLAAVVLALGAGTVPLRAQAPAANRPDTALIRRAERQRSVHEALLNDWASLSRYRRANDSLPAPTRGENRVVYIGDSITESWAGYFPALFPGRPYIGRGISDQTTPQILVRFRQDVVALQPKVVVILAGTNDIAGNTGPSSLAMIEHNIASMAEIARANGIRVVLSSVLPVYDYPWKRGLYPAPKISALNSWIRRYSEETGAVYLDYHTAMVDSRGGLRAELTRDGVHPNAAGYAVMAPLAEGAIAEALRGAAAAVTQTPSAAERVSAELARLDQEWQHAVVAGDAQFIQNRTADDFLFTHGSGARGDSKADWIRRTLQVPRPYLERRVSAQSVEVHGDIGMVFGRLDVRASGQTGSNPRCYAVQYAHLYALRNGRWLFVSHRTTQTIEVSRPCPQTQTKGP